MSILPSSTPTVQVRGRRHIHGTLAARALAIGLLTVTLHGCDPQRIARLEEGVATEADVKREFGEPEAVWDGPQGTKVLEYNRQPEGHKNYQITIGADGKMSALRQLLTPENFAKVQPGMSMEEVRRRLGKPAEVQKFALSEETHMRWRFRVGHGPQSEVFTVVLNPQMRVTRSSMGLDMKSADARGG